MQRDTNKCCAVCIDKKKISVDCTLDVSMLKWGEIIDELYYLMNEETMLQISEVPS